MEYFSVIMHGQGISVPSSEADNEIIGFYTTRWVKAATGEDAATAATKLVMRDWTEGEFVAMNRGGPPEVSIDSVASVSLFKYLWRRPGGGYSFYSSE